MTTALTAEYSDVLQTAIDELEVALPPQIDQLDQDEEWIVVNTPDGWRKIRLHNYGDVYSIPGLYEKWVYEIFQCRSPVEVSGRLIPAVEAAGQSPAELTVLDLGAGNGYVAGVLRQRGVERFVGVDIFKEAAEATHRDRPGLYDDYVVGDITALTDEQEQRLDRSFNCLTVVAALGFGDIPPEVFINAFNRIDDGGWIAFTIKRDFVRKEDRSGFAKLIDDMVDGGHLDVAARDPFVHRTTAKGEKLEYEAFVGRKHADYKA